MSLSEKLAKRTFPTKDVQLCLDAALSAERDALMAELSAARKKSDARLSSTSKGLTKQVAELEDQMRAATITIRITGMPFAEYNKIMRAHPPRSGRQEVFDPETFYPDVAYKAGSLVEGDQVTKLSESPRAEWDELMGVLTDGEFDALALAVNSVNRTLSGVGFLGRSSEQTDDSDETSGSPETSE